MGYKCESSARGNADYDVLVHGLGLTLEIKNDAYAKKSGNIALEYNNCKSNKPSGITATKADIWCHIIDNIPYIVLTSVLRKYIEDNKPYRIVKRAGDGNADLYLYTIDDILSIFIPLNKIEDLWKKTQ